MQSMPTSSPSQRAVQAAIFDLDGTLIDSLADIGLAMNRALAAHGLAEHPIEDYRRFIGAGARELAARVIGAAQDDALVQRVFAAYRDDYGANMLVHTVPYPGIVATLEALQDAGVAIAVLSNKPDTMTRPIVAQLFAGLPFVEVQGQRDGVPRKPDPTAALAIAQRAGVDASCCAFVGDSRIDMQTAVAAGMIPVGVAWGFEEPGALREHGARYLVDDAAALRMALLG